MINDVIIIGGGPAGLAAALTLGRGRKRVRLCDAGPRRNAAAVHVHNFVTRDGVTPNEFRRIAREQLAAYPNVSIVDEPVAAIGGSIGAFEVRLGDGSTVTARRILLCTGMVDDVPAIPGMRELWGHAVFQCPYCHGWEIRGGKWGFIADPETMGHFGLLLRGWTAEVIALTNGAFEVPPEAGERLTKGGVRIDERPIARLASSGNRLQSVVFSDGGSAAIDALFIHPPQRQVAVVAALGLDLDDHGFVRVNEQHQTSVEGIYAGGDLVSKMQSAIIAAASGSRAAGMLNLALTSELAMAGELDLQG